MLSKLVGRKEKAVVYVPGNSLSSRRSMIGGPPGFGGGTSGRFGGAAAAVEALSAIVRRQSACACHDVVKNLGSLLNAE